MQCLFPYSLRAVLSLVFVVVRCCSLSFGIYHILVSEILAQDASIGNLASIRESSSLGCM